MSTMDVSVVLRLIDELTGPAKAAGRSIADVQKRLTDLTRASSSGADTLPRSLMRAAEAAKLTGQQIQGLAQRYENVTRAIRGMKAADGLAVRSNWINAQTKELDQLAAAAKRAEAAKKRAAGGGTGIIGSSARMVGGFLVAQQAARAIKSGFDQSFSVQQTSAMLQAQGESQETINRAMALSRKMAAENTQFTAAQHLRAMSELRPAMIGGFEEAMKLAPDFQKAVGVLESIKSTGGLKGVDSHGEALDLARFLEIKGVTKDGEDAIHGYMNSLTKAIVSFNGQLTAADFHQTAKMGRGATRGWSQEFVEQFLPTLMNDLKTKGGTATGAGNALASFSRVIVDRVMKSEAAQAFVGMGLVEKGKILRSKKGKVIGIGEGGIRNWQLAMANPYKWMQQELIPAMVRQNGGKMPGEEDILKRMGTLFGNRVAQAIANIMAVQKEQIEKDAQNTVHAMGLSASQFLAGNSPVAQMQSFAAAFKDMAGAFASPMAGPALRAMKGLADMMRSITAGTANVKDQLGVIEGLNSLIDGVFKLRYGAVGHDDPDSMTPAFNPTESDGWYSIGKTVGDDLRQFGKDISEGINASQAQIKAIPNLVESIADAFYQADKWLRDKLAWIPGVRPQGESTGQPFGPWQHAYKTATAPKLPGMLSPDTTVSDPSKKPWYMPKGQRDYTLGNGTNRFSHKTENTYGGIGQVTEQATEALKQLPTAAVPDLSDIGTRIMQSISGGMQKSAGLVTGQMASLMASLQGIAGGGINIPVHIDSGGVSGQVRGAIQKASSPGGATIHNTFNVHGSDPDAVARKVHARFRSSVADHLSDIG